MVYVYDNGPDAQHPKPAERPGALLDELGVLTGYDIEGLHAAREAAIHRRHDASMEIARIKAEMATDEARFGMRGQVSHYEHERSSFLATTSERIRSEYQRASGAALENDPKAKPERLTDGRVDDMARASEAYRDYLHETMDERRRYTEAQAALARAYAEQEKENGVIAYLQDRINTYHALVYYARKDYNNQR